MPHDVSREAHNGSTMGSPPENLVDFMRHASIYKRRKTILITGANS